MFSKRFQYHANSLSLQVRRMKLDINWPQQTNIRATKQLYKFMLVMRFVFDFLAKTVAYLLHGSLSSFTNSLTIRKLWPNRIS